MHQSDDIMARWQRSHLYLGATHGRNEGRTRLVLILTLVMMVAEVAAGTVFNSMALVADGWHMASHAAALGIASAAYMYARRHAANETYSFGTGKVGDLGGFASALILAMIAILMGWESINRLMSPVPIAYAEATGIAALGLVVNLISALMLGNDHGHSHGPQGHGHDHQGHDHHDHHDHDHHHQDHGHSHKHAHHRDHNFRAVYVHILADAVTSVLAITALLLGRYLGLAWLDPLMGLVGGAIILQWAWTLIGSTSRVLLDAEPAPGLSAVVRGAIECDGDNRVADLHVWRLGPGHLAAMLTVVTHHPKEPAHYKALLAGVPGLSHVTVEVEHCAEDPRAVA
jgi:cation diffusion facilitator family transporter